MNLKSQLQGLATRTAILQEYTQAVAQQYRITPAEIARRVGVSRERVRQVTAEMGLDLSGLKVFVAKAQATGSETKKDACPTCDGLKSVAAITCMTCRRSTKPTHDQCECGALKLLKSARCPKCHQGYLTLRMRGPGTISSARPAVLETAMIVEDVILPKAMCPTCRGVKTTQAVQCRACRKVATRVRHLCECGAEKTWTAARCQSCHLLALHQLTRKRMQRSEELTGVMVECPECGGPKEKTVKRCVACSKLRMYWRKRDTCACGAVKVVRAVKCQTCHLQEVHRRRWGSTRALPASGSESSWLGRLGQRVLGRG